MKPVEKIIDGVKELSLYGEEIIDGVKELSINGVRQMSLDGVKRLTLDATRGANHVLNRVIFAKPIRFKSKSASRSRRPVLDPTEAKFLTSVVTGHDDFVLSHLNPLEVRMLIDSMEKFEVSSGDKIIEQGDVGDYLYVLREGSVQFLVSGIKTGTAGPGAVMGELSLLYDCPRSTTVIADSDCLLYRVSRETFRRVQVSFIMSSDDETRRLLRGTKLFGDLPDDLIREMASYLHQKKFRKGEILAKKGQEISEIYFLKEGRCLVRDITSENTVYADLILEPGNCFGERAIVVKSPCAGNVECLTDGVAYILTKERFLHCMQDMDLHEIIKKGIDAAILRILPFFANSDISRIEINEMVKKLKHVTLEPGEVLSTIGEEVEPALYYIETKSQGTGYVEVTTSDGVTLKLGALEPFGFGKDAAILSNLADTDCHAAALYGKDHHLVKLDTEEAIHISKRKLLERNIVISQSTVKALGTETVHLRKLAFEDIKDVIYDPLRLGKDYRTNRSHDASITYETLEKKCLLGQGTFGQVWLCKDPSHDLPYALKIQYKRELIDQDQAGGVIRETSIMREMHHPFVMGLIHAQQDPQCLYMVMELVQGGELRQQMRNADRPHLSEPATKFYAACMLEGLSYMHRRECIYRDLKGENVLLDKDGYCVIIDLGFAKHVPDKTFTFCGTPIFIAPEVLLNKGHDKSADIWSLGVMIYEMLFGTNPFFDYDDPCINQRTLFKRIARAHFQRPKKQSSLDAYANASYNGKDLIRKLLVVEPNKRLGCMAQADLDIRNHPWFAEDIDFGKLYRKELEAPWVPELKDPFDTTKFKAKCAVTKSGLKKLNKSEQEKFKDFC